MNESWLGRPPTHVAPFRRVAWVSDAAQALWAPRLDGVHVALAATLRRLIAEGRRGAALLSVDAAGAAPIEAPPGSAPWSPHTGSPRRFVLTASPLGPEPWASLYRRIEPPPCCAAFHRTLDGRGDATTAQALNTPGLSPQGDRLSAENPGAVAGASHPLGLSPISYVACSMGCGASRARAAEVVARGAELGFREEMVFLEALCGMPLAWSSCHGVAELKTPLLKVVLSTDHLPKRREIHLRSDRYPEEGAQGVVFPFRSPSVLRVTDSERFRSGRVPAASALRAAAPASPIHLEVERRGDAILQETAALLASRGATEGRRVRRLQLTHFFNVVELDDGSTGACMNYFRFKSERARERAQRDLVARMEADPLLLGGSPESLLELSVKASVVSALSRRSLERPEGFEVTDAFDTTWLPEVGAAVVVGFGGYLNYLLYMTKTPHIHVMDLRYHSFGERGAKWLDWHRARSPDRKITLSDGSDYRARVAEAELVCVTGSALCTGTMERILGAATGRQRMVVQGQSASILPQRLFARGVDLVSTTLKPPGLIDVARTDRDRFKRLLEGELPRIYLTPPAPPSQSGSTS